MSQHGQWQQPGWGAQPSGGQPGGWPQQGGWQQSGGWQQPGGWHQQGAWQQPGGQQQGAWPQQGQQSGAWQPGGAAPSGGGNASKRILGILVGVCALALVGFVVLLFANRGPSYENEDYQAPPPSSEAPDQIPIPASDDDAWEVLRNNPMYNGAAPDSVNCEMTAVDRLALTNEQLQDHFNDLSECLMRVWDRPMTAQGITMFRPFITVYSSEIVTGCGNVDETYINAFYCGADQMLYYNADLHLYLPELLNRWGIEAALAHEFAHFMQGRAGIVGARMRLYQNMDVTERNAMTRRSELQADCFTGQWMRANTQAAGVTEQDREGLRRLFESLGDDPNAPEKADHGAAEMRRAWFDTGNGTAAMGTCNTWIVPDEQVR